MSTTETAPLALTTVHTYAAPRRKVFEAWTDPARVKRWWGPKAFTTELFEADFRPGGAWRAVIRQNSNGELSGSHGLYEEIVDGELIRFSFKWELEGAPDTVITVTFADAGGLTRLTFHQDGFEIATMRDSHIEGWDQLLDKLVPYLAGEA
jgi:uncharacterized protein YndB with AHSA1/START domain